MTSRAKLALALLALVALVALVYAPVKHGVFVWDDHALVETNPLVEKGSVLEIFKQPFWMNDPMSDARPAYYRPLAVLSLRADFAVAGAEAAAFHVTNLLLHLTAMLLLVAAARRLGATAPASLVAGGVWALLPRSTESVAWISGRTDVLAAVMVLGAIVVWPWYAEADATDARAGRRAVAAGVLVLLGLLSKEVAIASVFAISAGTIAGTRAVTEGRWALVARRLAYVAVPVVAYVVLRLLATRGIVSRANAMGPETRAATVCEAVGRYTEMTLDAWHPRTSIGLIGELDRGRAIVGAFVIAISIAVVVHAIIRGRRAKARARAGERDAPSATATSAGIAAAAGLGLGSLALVLHVLPVVIAAGVAADRLLYLPLAGLALVLAIASARVSVRTRRIAAGIAIALGASFIPATNARAADYTDEVRFRVVAAENAHPRNTSAKSGLANVLRADTEYELACKLHASVRRSLERTGRTGTPRHLRALENLGGCYEMLGDYDLAAAVYNDLIAIHPDGARVHMEIGYLHLHQFAIEQAEKWFRSALALEPALEPARRALAALPAVRVEMARLASAEARRADPLGWARLLTRVGRVGEATAAWAALLEDAATPDDPAWEGLKFLFANADLPTARRAAERYFERDLILKPLGTQMLQARVREQARIDALRPRMEALAAE